MLFHLATLVAFAVASPTSYNARPYAHAVKRQSSYDSSNLKVDLGYSVYEGYSNATAKLDVFKGIRFAAPPIGSLRWQTPRAPEQNRSSTIPATAYAPTCPQSGDSAYGTVQPANQSLASEDCLFLNIWTPSNATGPLPVFVWIHGGGYGAGSGRQDLTAFINTNDNAFVGVAIQYRLGAFGFLSSDEVYRKGVVNAGLLDQHLALQWVQQYIHQFNGDPTQVTISGESAGGGSVMLQDMAYGGSLGKQLFVNSIAASPYLPMQYVYKDWVPSQSYYAFATKAGCAPTTPYLKNGSTPIFECLVSKDSATLINASATVSQEGSYGTWAFLPVTDGIIVQDLPSRQLGRGKVNGLNMLVGNNAAEALFFTPQVITTEDELVAYLRVTFPLFSNNDIAKILFYYPSSNASVPAKPLLFATEGDTGPTALNESSVGSGQQERADDIYAETTFVCPAYWMAEAYSNNRAGGQGYKYQFSIPPATHGADVAGYFDYPGQFYSVDFTTAFQKIWGNFVTSSNPSISNAVANGLSRGNVSVNAASAWPPYSIYAPEQLDLNTTCPVVSATGSCAGPSAVNDFRLVNAYTWEGGRGTRCDFWKSMGDLVPE
ncbi:hypothetical protein LTR91_013682 [Friedmanniomyces endolithicus]|uniref:Carboxylesterase type B domain-containing protein n=1 Tax=Friedmanniomyces endolithicus TaxID=329885 RepID=A0AAN6KDC1_9PEZI|nr:hypothetical protein LTS02_001671 [Friedmanniomyces endolithicus]KAK0875911.1 hypothetical protein LTR87_010255 [Friedmanniomyces endolithicus]KAK0967700.1 hypothetical protein LTS01_017129 [Friedmanniomyces endolithicus]KAK0976450.1 hypothetical protein LTR91_013682 [Friedmanniomyces endolithicus]KAK1038045.1 hypothetical protein LTS16_012346 [Friedmanniomyces endolithicus]